MEYQNVREVQAKRKKVLMLSLIISIFLHLLLFFTFRMKFVPYKKVTVSRVMRLKRVRISQGSAPGPLSASAARKSAPSKKPSKAPVKRKRNVKPRRSKSRLKVASKKKKDFYFEENAGLLLDQDEEEIDVLSMIEGEQLIPGGGNLGTGDDVLGLVYDESTIFEYGEEEEEVVVAKYEPPEVFLGTMATPVVVSKPYTSIEENFTDIPYPDDMKIKKEKLRSGICRVYLRVSVNSYGEIRDIYIRSPKTEDDKVKYKIFLDTVLDTVNEWRFDHQEALVFVDVRFTIE
jgi:hypothetical protein